MSSLDLPFYATADEFADWIPRWCEQSRSFLAVTRFPPITLNSAEPADVPKLIADSNVCQFGFLTEPFDARIKYQNEFFDDYSNQLVLQIGHLTPDGLEESWLSYKTDDTNALTLWKRVRDDLKQRTKAGVTQINLQARIAHLSMRYRYSDGAMAMERVGVPMLPLGGKHANKIVRLGEVEHEY